MKALFSVHLFVSFLLLEFVFQLSCFKGSFFFCFWVFLILCFFLVCLFLVIFFFVIGLFSLIISFFLFVFFGICFCFGVIFFGICFCFGIIFFGICLLVFFSLLVGVSLAFIIRRLSLRKSGCGCFRVLDSLCVRGKRSLSPCRCLCVVDHFMWL